jgi:hypothetical protein
MDGIPCGRRFSFRQIQLHATGDLRRRQNLAVLPGNPMISLGRLGKRWENNIKIELNKRSSVATDLIQFLNFASNIQK